MKKLKLPIIIISICFLSFNLEAQSKFYIKVDVKNIENNTGKVYVALYNTEASFLETLYKGTFSTIENNSCSVNFRDIPEGTYAVSIFHDENDNGKLDTNFFGIPKEDYGCSNNAKGFMGPPRWQDAKFLLNKNKTITISL